LIESAEDSCIRKAMSERGLIGSHDGLSDTISLNEAVSRWADCGSLMGIEWPVRRPLGSWGGLSGPRNRSAQGHFGWVPRQARAAVQGFSSPLPQGGRRRLGLGHHSHHGPWRRFPPRGHELSKVTY